MIVGLTFCFADIRSQELKSFLTTALTWDYSRVMVCHSMATINSLLIFLCLISCSHQLKLRGPSVQTGFSGEVRLECNPDMGESMDFGVFWFRQKKDSKNPESIVFLSTTKKTTYSDPNHNRQFSPDKTGSAYTLTIKSFGQMDQGTYYCMINKNSVLYISPGFSLFYPEVTTTRATTTKAPTPEVSTKMRTKDACGCSLPKPVTPPPKEWEIFGLTCDPYVWAPLIGLCSLLLFCLLVTSIMLCFRTRRRRCRCKHKPLDENNGKMIAPRKPR
ncbi:T-cell surface glycoprotein CD8 alpha chain-like [Mixophyes fleayi]|uniref:T-cell surface glycoprotein CD8 alpha chain-like n=1 Tax=Mixophyes fleayi TaxID=3061075 RepID=UPI003F4DB241